MGRRLRFRGEFTNKVDGKGRVSIPAPFRRVLEKGDPDWTEGLNPNFVIVYGDGRRKFLECYTIEEMEEVEAKISKKKRGSAQRRALELLFLSQSMTTNVDETGRIVIPARLRDKIGLDGTAQFAGTADTFQIWSPEAYDAEVAATEEYLEEQGEDFDPLTLLDDDDDSGEEA
ncbi:division/cell wall cluster transcriptional repressor MraZ [Ponticoccus alexandrii]|uniref:Transcriptional regulator MraZ n=1 Tax=Ponticoccus alexandrii TaxID=1943633 RepID=A0ABX7FBM6_9RHOB|nr:division/cell wall cluster transcriptional repressor MraZ [Ponticoccus alexandrii]ETA50413.1 cell division protein MraZ [Rhodobacteraceae bacterium PD-2]QRF67118.1 division/cell wall cluster transcriptional repressor MraZ [Ponticoccus alexandrii]